MRCRLYFEMTGVLLAGSLLGGCAMIDHSNTLLFGTNTSVGVQAGVDANNIPSINIGYKRQEAVFLPLQSNLKNDKGEFVPCPGTAPRDNSAAHESCKFVATNGQGQAKDAYSVLASFGADIKAGAGEGKADASVGLAQYFATGAAAQLLALKGGAAVVAVGEAAKESAKTEVPENAVLALVGDANVMAAANQIQKTRAQKREELANVLEKLSDADFVKEQKEITTAANGKRFCIERNKDLNRLGCVAAIRKPTFDANIDIFYDAFKKTEVGQQ